MSLLRRFSTYLFKFITVYDIIVGYFYGPNSIIIYLSFWSKV